MSCITPTVPYWSFDRQAIKNRKGMSSCCCRLNPGESPDDSADEVCQATFMISVSEENLAMFGIKTDLFATHQRSEADLSQIGRAHV